MASVRECTERAKSADDTLMRADRTRRDRCRIAGGLRAGCRRIGPAAAAIASIVGLGASGAVAADDPVLDRIDFEDRETATADWSHVFEQAPGLPRRSLFFDAVVDERIAAAGGSSLRLDLEGGSISYRMRPEAAVAVSRDADYRVSARVMTESLRHATARLEIRVVDGRTLDTRRATSEDPVADATISLVHAEVPPGSADRRWSEVSAVIRTDGDRFQDLDDLRLFVALQVVQPGHDDRADGRPELFPTVHLEDIDGRAWFDEIEVRRSPRLRIAALAPSGLVRTVGPIPFDVVVDDPTGAIVEASVELRDVDGDVLDRRSLEVAAGPRHRIELEPGRPGWFEAVLRVADADGRLARRGGAVVALPDESAAGGREAPRFGVSIADWTPERLDLIEQALAVLDPDAVELPIWPESNDTRASLEGVDGVRRLLDRQRRAGREPMLAIDRLHGGLAATARVEPHAIAAALRDDVEGIWRRAIGDWMLRLGTAIARWRVDAGPAEGVPALLAELASSLVADPVLLVGDPFERSRTAAAGDEPCRLGAVDLSSEAQSALSTGVIGGGTVVLTSPPRGWRSRDRVDAAARRGLAAWRDGADRILLRWDPGTAPDPAIVAWTGLARGLGSRRPAGELRVSPTATCLIGDDEGGAVLVAWSDLAEQDETILIPVGAGEVEVVELDGRRRRRSTDDGILELRIDATPRFVTGVDRLAILVAATTRFDPAIVEVGRNEHRIDLLVRNPIAAPIEGELRIDPPAGWSIEPSRPHIRAAAGETTRIPVTVAWSGPRVLGDTVIPMRLDIRSPRAMRIPMEVPLTLRSDALVVTADWSIARGGPVGRSPLIVSVELENVGDRPLDLEVTASAWRVGRERRLITGLRPGEREIRRVPLRAGMDRLAGTELLIEVRELEGAESVAVRLPVVGGSAGEATAVVPTP